MTMTMAITENVDDNSNDGNGSGDNDNNNDNRESDDNNIPQNFSRCKNDLQDDHSMKYGDKVNASTMTVMTM